ncbi:MAG: 23S ribosomal RNA methyltransferase Erm [Dehalococcoidia bacterium]|nr:23S ribosomal RNA methyltransferase Erm [Dehalococcoidia bacterium]
MFGQSRGRSAPPALGQHFLRRGALAASLVQQTSVTRQDLVLEIGAGEGALTRPLAARAGRVLAVEVDARFAAVLREQFAADPRVEVVEADFLRLALPSEPYKVAGNVPFARTAEIVRRLTEAWLPPEDAYLVVQLEAAQRIAGAPVAAESLASLRLKPWWHIELARRLGRRDFEPPPDVDAAMLWLARRPRPLVDPEAAPLYRDFIAAGFGRRGQTVRASLGGAFTHRQLARLAHDLRFRLDARPSELSFDQWLGLFRAFALLAAPRARQAVHGATARLPR